MNYHIQSEHIYFIRHPKYSKKYIHLQAKYELLKNTVKLPLLKLSLNCFNRIVKYDSLCFI